MGCCLGKRDKQQEIQPDHQKQGIEVQVKEKDNKKDDNNNQLQVNQPDGKREAIEVQVQGQKKENQNDAKNESVQAQQQVEKGERQSEQEIIVNTSVKQNPDIDSNLIEVKQEEPVNKNLQSEQEIAKSLDMIQTQVKQGKLIINIIQENIVKQKVQAIVNAANAQLARGGGVCGAIFQVCGYQLDKDCDEITKDKPLKTSEVVITSSHDLQKQGDDYPKYIIHAVGPVWDGSEARKDLLRKCVYNVLKLAMDKNIQTLSIPAISSGIYGFPKDICAQLFEDGINQFKKDFCNQQDNSETRRLDYEMTVNLCNFDYETFYIFNQHFNKDIIEFE